MDRNECHLKNDFQAFTLGKNDKGSPMSGIYITIQQINIYQHSIPLLYFITGRLQIFGSLYKNDPNIRGPENILWDQTIQDDCCTPSKARCCKYFTAVTKIRFDSQ